MKHREILRIAIPAIISNITTPLLGLVDTAITGHLGAAVYLAAIAVGSTMFSMIYWVMNFLRMGSSGLTAQAYGANDINTARSILRQGMSIALYASTAMILLSPWLADMMLSLMDAGTDTTAMARQYFMIVIWGAPAVLGTYALSGWMLGMQDSRGPMWMALTTNMVNIIVSLVLVYVFGLKIEGVATGTVTAQWAGIAVGLILYRKHIRHMFDTKGSSVSPKRFFKVNTDIMLRTLCLVTVTVWFTRTGAGFGNETLAANSLLMQLFILFSYFMDGFAFAGEALSGKYYGARDRRGLSQAIKGVFVWGLWVSAAFTVAYLLCGNLVLGVLTDDTDVITTAKAYLPWAIAVPAAGMAAFAWDGVFIGLTLTRQMLWAMVTAMGTYFIGYWVLTPTLGNHGLWIAFISYLAVRGICQSIIYYRIVHGSGTVSQ